VVVVFEPSPAAAVVAAVRRQFRLGGLGRDGGRVVVGPLGVPGAGGDDGDGVACGLQIPRQPVHDGTGGRTGSERLDDATKFPIAARNKFGHVRVKQDRVTAKLPGLQAYQLSLAAPRPRSGFNRAAARRGKAVFDGAGRCASCHMPPTFTDSGWNLHRPEEICTDNFQAQRSPTNGYRTTPLRGVATHAKGGFYHDGRFSSLLQVVQHYNSCMNLGLSGGQQSDLVQYLRSL